MKTTWAIFRILAGDKRAGWTREQKFEAVKRGEDALSTDPVHDFYVVAEDDLALMGVAMAPVFKKFGARSSDDLPKPFSMERVEIGKGEEIVATEATAADVARIWLGKTDAEVHVATKSLYHEMAAEAKEKRRCSPRR